MEDAAVTACEMADCKCGAEGVRNELLIVLS